MSKGRKPVNVIQAQAMTVIKDALEKWGWKITREQYDGLTRTDSVTVRSRGVNLIVLVADPAYMDEADPAPFVKADGHLLQNPPRKRCRECNLLAPRHRPGCAAPAFKGGK